jgi:hypothetical protein
MKHSIFCYQPGEDTKNTEHEEHIIDYTAIVCSEECLVSYLESAQKTHVCDDRILLENEMTEAESNEPCAHCKYGDGSKRLS